MFSHAEDHSSLKNQVTTMSGDQILIIFNLLCILYFPSDAQRKANRKCTEYMKIPKSFSKIGHGIIGGTLSHDKEFPHMVVLGYGRNYNIKWLCGGTIISENYILTAAHCSMSREYGPVNVVLIGVRNLNDPHGETIGVAQIIKHPNYQSPSHYNDIALLKLSKSIQFSRSVLPACLNTVFNIRPRTNKLVATGWGLLACGGHHSSDDLMKVELNLYNYQQCQQKYINVSKRRLSTGINQTTQICAGGGTNEENDTCRGDSGGPLAIKNEAIYSIVGVTSFGKACGIPNTPGVYTRVSAFVPWIEKIVWS